MFDILQADIVIMQELKIQRKDLTDDMVLVPGWDCYFSLPKHKKGKSASRDTVHHMLTIKQATLASESIPANLCAHPFALKKVFLVFSALRAPQHPTAMPLLLPP